MSAWSCIVSLSPAFRRGFASVAFLLATLGTGHSAILAGTFDFSGATGAGSQLSSTASFTYNTATNLGTLKNFYAFFGLVGDFDFMVMPTNYAGTLTPAAASNYVTVNSFSDLTDFTLRSKVLTEGIDAGQTVQYYNNWVLLDSSISPGYHFRIDGWSYRGTALFNPPVAFGTFGNFTATSVPEPATSVMAAIAILPCLRRRPHR